jgi:cell wall assembly regulator SMI1
MKFSAYLKAIQKLYTSCEVELPLNRPSTAAAVDDLARKFGDELPAELRNGFLATDGVPNEKPFFANPGSLTSYGFLSAKAALKQRDSMRKRSSQYAGYVEQTPRDPRIAPGWFNDGWFPFAAFGGGSLLLIVDSSPTARGASGQIIAFTHDPDEMTYVAPSFERFLAASLKAAQEDPEEFLQIF